METKLELREAQLLEDDYTLEHAVLFSNIYLKRRVCPWQSCEAQQ